MDNLPKKTYPMGHGWIPLNNDAFYKILKWTINEITQKKFLIENF